MRFIKPGLRACPADDGAGSAPLAHRQTGAAGRKWRWSSGPTARETFNEDGFITTRDNPATPENDVEIMQENHYYPFGMNHDGRWFGPQDPENRYTYNGKEYTPELGLDWYDYGARWYDAALGRWGQVDPLADIPHSVSISPYHYVANNPIIRIDPNGQDWYPNGEGKTIWRDSKDESYTDDDCVEWHNIGEELLFFGSKNLIYYTQSENEDGSLVLETHVYSADSGKPLKDDTFDYSKERQAIVGRGPVPEGEYSIKPNEIQNWNDLNRSQQTKALVGRGQWPGGTRSWGEHRVWVNPYEITVVNPATGERVVRTGITIHGGEERGSAGCIDLCTDHKRFFQKLKKSNQLSIKLIVRYPDLNKKTII